MDRKTLLVVLHQLGYRNAERRLPCRNDDAEVDIANCALYRRMDRWDAFLDEILDDPDSELHRRWQKWRAGGDPEKIDDALVILDS